jgi:hypothetical protein
MKESEVQDDAKKMGVLAVLGLALVGVGAFQLMPQPGEKPAPTKKAWTPPVKPSTVVEKEPVPNPSVIARLPKRDPFDAPKEAEALDPANEQDQSEGDEAETSPGSSDRPVRSGSRRLRPLPGSFKRFNALPDPDLDVEPIRPKDEDIQKIAINEGDKGTPEPVFDYSLGGVIIGRRNAAVFRDKQGGQRLVTAGSAIDGEATLIDVRPGAVIVDFRGKRLRIEIQGDQDAK